MMLDEITRTLTPVADAFDALGIPYFIGGSVALHAHSAYRMTNDMDLVADVHIEHANPLEARLKALFYADAYMIRQAVLRASSFNVIHFETAIKVDVFILKQTPYMQGQMQRRISGTLLPNGRLFSFVSAEDMILSKLDWYRIGGEMSERQWNDIKGVLRSKDDDLDYLYMVQWAKQIGVSDLLSRAVKEMEAERAS